MYTIQVCFVEGPEGRTIGIGSDCWAQNRRDSYRQREIFSGKSNKVGHSNKTLASELLV